MVGFVPKEMFFNSDPRQTLRLEDKDVETALAHEAFHVWQRQHGHLVTSLAAIQQALLSLGILDPYSYDGRGDDVDIYSRFVLGGVEEQAQIFEDYVRADLDGNAATAARYRRVAWHVRTWK